MENGEQSGTAGRFPPEEFLRDRVVRALVDVNHGIGVLPQQQPSVDGSDSVSRSLGIGTSGRLVDQPAVERKAAEAVARPNLYLRKLSRKPSASSKPSWDRKTIGCRRIISGESTPVVAARTSPTNIGMALLCTLSAYDFGYLSVRKLVESLSATFRRWGNSNATKDTISNWYDTRTLAPLPPQYVSTVDDGNLAALLMTLHSGLLEIANQEWTSSRALAGLHDLAGVVGRSV
jgi:hypothetical protein